MDTVRNLEGYAGTHGGKLPGYDFEARLYVSGKKLSACKLCHVTMQVRRLTP